MRVTLLLMLLFVPHLSSSDVSCGESYGVREDLSQRIRVRCGSFEICEAFLPLEYREKRLNFVEVRVNDSAYFQLAVKEKGGVNRLHFSTESLPENVSLHVFYGDGRCLYKGIARIKHDKKGVEIPILPVQP